MRELTEQELLSVAGGAGNKTGFDRDTGQGNLDNDNGPGKTNPGTTTESGPHGQLKKDPVNEDHPNVTVDLPGKNR